MQSVSSPANSRSSTRQSNIELLRIIVMVMILGCHFATHGKFQFDSQTITISRLGWNFLEMGGNFGVVVFVLISGYFLIENDTLLIKPKKVIKLWGQIFFYSVTLFLASFLLGKGIPAPLNLVKAVFPITFDQWWFASTYFVLYLLHPYLNRALRSFSKKEYQRLLVLLILIWSVIPTFTATAFQSNPLLEFVLFYSIAGYIRLFGLSHLFSCKKWCALWLIFSAITYLSSVVFLFMGTKLEVFSTYALYFYKRNSILVLCSAVSFFMLFLNWSIKSNRFINRVSTATFGVYLLHDSNVLRPFLWETVFHNASFQNTALIIPYSIAVVCVVYIACTLIDLFRIHCIEKAFMKGVDAMLHRVGHPIEKLKLRLKTKV